MQLSFSTVDVFTSTRYLGNPLAIVQVPSSRKDTLTQAQKQAIAKEFNLSETVFMHESSKTSTEVAIDIFTTQAEIPFAGHPTIGSAFSLLHLQNRPLKTIITKAGRIPITYDGTTGLITADIPHNIHINALSLTCPLNSTPNPLVSIVNGMTFCYVPLSSLSVLAKATTNLYDDMYSVDRLDDGWRNGLVGTMYYVSLGTDASGKQKFRTRMWDSSEDPATGSASSGLGAYLALREEGDGTFRYALTQGVEMGNTSEIAVEVLKEGGKIVTVGLSGTAVKVMEGTLEV